MYSARIETLYAGPMDGLENIAPVVIDFAVDTIKVRGLISAAVELQVLNLNKEQAQVKERFQRQYLSNQDVLELAEQGRILLQDDDSERKFNPQTCIAAALEGFRRRRYFIAVNGIRPLNLDDSIVLLPNTEVQFVRLVPLIGG